MSLVQQGIKTARSKNRKMKGSKGIQFAIPNEVKYDKDAQVLNKTCPKWGILVAGFQ